MPASTPRLCRRPAVAILLALIPFLAASTLAAGPAAARPLTQPTRLRGVTITEYFPVPERWFVGRKVSTPGLPGLHRVDWLYSATGISMEGDGLGLDGQPYHIDNLGAGGWITSQLRSTRPGTNGWGGGSPAWRSGGFWRNAGHALTFPLEAGGWSNGAGLSSVPPPAGITFARGPSRPLSVYRTIAVDPALIPLGSRVYVPAYRATVGHGWFTAVDTGGAILGRHIDVYRSPPNLPGDGGNLYRDQMIVIYPPGTSPPRGAPAPARISRPGPSGSGSGAPHRGSRTQAPKDTGGATPGG